MTLLLLARHGETDWNRDGRWQGHSDTPLNDRGREQAHELAQTVDGVDVIYASDLARARETAEIVGEHVGAEVRLDPRLRERRFGAWEGLHGDDLPRLFPEEFARWQAGAGWGAADAESYDEFAARVREFVDDVLRLHPGGRLLVIGHGGSLRVIHALAAGLDFVKDRQALPSIGNCVLSRCEFRDGKLARID